MIIFYDISTKMLKHDEKNVIRAEDKFYEKSENL